MHSKQDIIGTGLMHQQDVLQQFEIDIEGLTSRALRSRNACCSGDRPAAITCKRTGRCRRRRRCGWRQGLG